MIKIKYETGPNPNTTRPYPCLQADATDFRGHMCVSNKGKNLHIIFTRSLKSIGFVISLWFLLLCTSLSIMAGSFYAKKSRKYLEQFFEKKMLSNY